MITITPELVERYISDGMICSQYHPDHPNLLILNYTQAVQYGRLWDEFTLSARGLVIDTDTYEIVARPFSKFFNLTEHQDGEIPVDEKYTVWEKLDGSLGILFNYKGEWIWATRGSFTSDQVVLAKEMFKSGGYSYDDLDDSYTHLFEVVYAQNRIVVDYGGDNKLVSLGSIHTKTGVEIGPNSTFPVPRKFDLKIDELSTYNESNFEGFVIKFESGFRVKVKMEDYVRLHRIVFGLSSVSIWESLVNGTYEELCSTIPEEFLPWVVDVSTEMLRDYHKLMYEAYVDYRIHTVADDRKQTAINYTQYGKQPTSARFAILDGKDPSVHVWKTLRPEHKTIQ